MKYCRFCGNVEETRLKFCKQCGYLQEKVRISDDINSDKFSRIGSLQVRFGEHSIFSRRTPPKEIVLNGYDLFMFWQQLHNAYQHNCLNYEVTADTLTLYTTLQGEHNVLSYDRFPSHIPSTIVFVQELVFDRYDPATGYRVYKTERIFQGSLSVDKLSQEQRIKFLRWFLSSYPHATLEGTLCFEL